MNFIIMGFPGSGKGTQSEKICKKYGIKHLSTGDLFRKEITNQTVLGNKVNEYIKNGNLVPDEITIEIFRNELKKEIYDNGFLLDGFPRTLEQAKSFTNLITEENLKLDCVINLNLDEDVIIKRIINRQICPSCGSTFHKLFVKPVIDGKCDTCSTELIQRKDDTLEAITNRLDVAKKETLPVVKYFSDLKMIKEIKILESDSTQQVFDQIIKIIEN